MRYRATATLLLTIHLAGCTHWQVTSLAAPELDPMPAELRVQLRDSTILVFRSPVIARDSLMGLAGPDRRGTARSRLAVAVADVTRVERSVTDGSKTALLVIGTAAVVGSVLLLGFSCDQSEVFC